MKLELVIRKVPVERILKLRHEILRAGLPFDAARFPGDQDSTTAHYAAFTDDSETAVPVACASFMLNEWQGEPAWQLRGMAIAAELQGRGIGRALLDRAEQELAASSNVMLFWCNARVPALGFYLKQGWIVASEEFDIPTAGPHRKLTKRRAL